MIAFSWRHKVSRVGLSGLVLAYDPPSQQEAWTPRIPYMSCYVHAVYYVPSHASAIWPPEAPRSVLDGYHVEAIIISFDDGW